MRIRTLLTRVLNCVNARQRVQSSEWDLSFISSYRRAHIYIFIILNKETFIATSVSLRVARDHQSIKLSCPNFIIIIPEIIRDIHDKIQIKMHFTRILCNYFSLRNFYKIETKIMNHKQNKICVKDADLRNLNKKLFIIFIDNVVYRSIEAIRWRLCMWHWQWNCLRYFARSKYS